jgi:hypothetical protein
MVCVRHRDGLDDDIVVWVAGIAESGQLLTVVGNLNLNFVTTSTQRPSLTNLANKPRWASLMVNSILVT